MDEDKGYQGRYGIIASEDVKEMARRVSEALDEDWQLCGALIVTFSPVGRVLSALLADAGFGHYHFWHPIDHRVLTFNELKTLASFPVQFHLCGEPGQRWARIGNSVPPLLMRSVACHIRQSILTNAQPVRVEA